MRCCTPSAFFALFYLFLAIGYWNFLANVNPYLHVQNLFEVLAIFFISTVIIVGFINSPDTSSAVGAVSKVFNIWYPLSDSLLIALSYLVFRAGRGKFQSAILILTLGLLVQVFADIIFSYRSGASLYWNGDMSDILFAISGSILSLSIVTIFFDFIASDQKAAV